MPNFEGWCYKKNIIDFKMIFLKNHLVSIYTEKTTRRFKKSIGQNFTKDVEECENLAFSHSVQ